MPERAAYMSMVLPSSMTKLGSTPTEKRSVIAFSSPLATASASGASPCLFWWKALAPRASSTFITSRLPASVATEKAVSPVRASWLAAAPNSSSATTASTLPARTAAISAVSPSAFS